MKMLKGRLIFMLSWSAFAWANLVIGAVMIGGLTRGWQAQMPSNNTEWLRRWRLSHRLAFTLYADRARQNRALANTLSLSPIDSELNRRFCQHG